MSNATLTEMTTGMIEVRRSLQELNADGCTDAFDELITKMTEMIESNILDEVQQLDEYPLDDEELSDFDRQKLVRTLDVMGVEFLSQRATNDPNIRIVLAKWKDRPSTEYVTWGYNIQADGFFLGHYYQQDLIQAYRNFLTR